MYNFYFQCICQQGHYYECGDLYEISEEHTKCPLCKSMYAWSNQVDDTNVDQFGKIPISVLDEKFLVEAGKKEKCNLGHEHVTPAIYRIPKSEETDHLGHYVVRDDAGKMSVVPIVKD